MKGRGHGRRPVPFLHSAVLYSFFILRGHLSAFKLPNLGNIDGFLDNFLRYYPSFFFSFAYYFACKWSILLRFNPSIFSSLFSFAPRLDSGVEARRKNPPGSSHPRFAPCACPETKPLLNQVRLDCGAIFHLQLDSFSPTKHQKSVKKIRKSCAPTYTTKRLVHPILKSVPQLWPLTWAWSITLRLLAGGPMAKPGSLAGSHVLLSFIIHQFIFQITVFLLACADYLTVPIRNSILSSFF